MSFLHGGLLGLAGLFSVPLIIHLLNKRRFQVVPWAAMEFLLNAYKRNRRRLRLESLLLLLLRCMIPVLLALAVARPRLSVPEDLPLTKAWQHHIVVLDRSYSMGYIEKNGNRPFERAKQLVAGLIQHGSRVGNDKVSLILVDGSVATTVKGDLDFGRAKRSLDQQEGPRDGVGDLLPALLEARRLVDSEGGAAILYVFSDFQQNLLERETPEEGAAHGAREESAARSGLTGSLAEVRDIFGDLEERGAKVVLVPVAPRETTTNTMITSLQLDPPTVVARVPTTLRTRITHRGPKPRELIATLEVDGKNPQAQSLRIKPGEDADLSFQLRFLDEGMHHVEVSLDQDPLPVDDVRRLAVRVRDRIRVLLVEGSGQEEARERILKQSFLYDTMLDPSDGEGPDDLLVFAPTIVDEERFQLDPSYMQDQDVIVLLNMTSPREAVAERLRRFVQAGGGLLIAPGADCSAHLYDLRLFGLSGEKGPLPLRLLDIQGSPIVASKGSGAVFPDRFATCRIEDPDHEVLADFRSDPILAQALEAIPVYRYWGVGRDDAPEDTRILLSLANTEEPSGGVLLAQRSFGRGRCLLLTSNLTRRPDRWNRLSDHNYVSFPLIHSCVRYLAGEATQYLNRLVGEPLSAWLEHRPSTLYLHRPGSKGRVPLPLPSARKLGPLPGWTTPPYEGTDRAGLYRLEVEFPERTLSAREIRFAVNPDTREGHLSYYTPSRLNKEFPGVAVQSRLFLEQASVMPGASTEIGRLILLIALLMLAGEAVLAAFMGGGRRS